MTLAGEYPDCALPAEPTATTRAESAGRDQDSPGLHITVFRRIIGYSLGAGQASNGCCCASVRLDEIKPGGGDFQCHHPTGKRVSIEHYKRRPEKSFLIGLQPLCRRGRAGNRAPHCPRQKGPGAIALSTPIFRRGQRQLAENVLSRCA